MEISNILIKCRVQGMGVVFNIEAGNDYNVHSFIMTRIKQEKLVFILVILYIQEYLWVFTNCLRVPGYPQDFQFLNPEITENAQL